MVLGLEREVVQRLDREVELLGGPTKIGMETLGPLMYLKRAARFSMWFVSTHQPEADKSFVGCVVCLDRPPGQLAPVMIQRYILQICLANTNLAGVLGNLGLTQAEWTLWTESVSITHYNTTGKSFPCRVYFRLSPHPCLCFPSCVPHETSCQNKLDGLMHSLTFHEPPEAASAAFKSSNNFGFHLTRVCTQDSWRRTDEGSCWNHRKLEKTMSPPPLTDGSCLFGRFCLRNSESMLSFPLARFDIHLFVLRWRQTALC